MTTVTLRDWEEVFDPLFVENPSRIRARLDDTTSGNPLVAEDTLIARMESRHVSAASAFSDMAVQIYEQSSYVPVEARAVLVSSVSDESLAQQAGVSAATKLKRSEARTAQKKYVWGKLPEFETSKFQGYSQRRKRFLQHVAGMADSEIKLITLGMEKEKAEHNLVGVDLDIVGAGIKGQDAQYEIQKAYADIDSSRANNAQTVVEIRRAGIDVEMAQLGALSAAIDVQKSEIEVRRGETEVAKSLVEVDNANLDAWAVEAKLLSVENRVLSSQTDVLRAQNAAKETAATLKKVTATRQLTEAKKRLLLVETQINNNVYTQGVEKNSAEVTLTEADISIKTKRAEKDVEFARLYTTIETEEAAAKRLRLEQDLAMREKEQKSRYEIAKKDWAIRKMDFDYKKEMDISRIKHERQRSLIEIRTTKLLSDISLSGDITNATAELAASEAIVLNSVNTNLRIGKMSAETEKYTGLKRIYTNERVTMASIAAQWDSTWVSAVNQVASADSRRMLADATLTISGNLVP